MSGNPLELKVAVKTLSRIEDRDSVEHFLREGIQLALGNIVSILSKQFKISLLCRTYDE